MVARNGAEEGRPPRISDVAALAGVSPATASRSLRGEGKVSASTRARVLDAARQLSYIASPQARGLATGRTSTLALVVPFVDRWYFASVLAAVADGVRDEGFSILLYHLGNAQHRDQFFEELPLARKVDGVVVVGMSLQESQAESLRRLRTPFVTLGSKVDGAPSVRVDEQAAVRLAVNHLVHQGHSRIAYIAGAQDDLDLGFTSSADRMEGFFSTMRAAGLPVAEDLVVSGAFGLRGGDVAMTQLIAGSVAPTAVVSEYDELALGAMWALRRAGWRVPEDVSVVGIDDHEMAPLASLTTVRQPVRDIGLAAAGLLLDVIADPRGSHSDLVLPTRLIVRGSTVPQRRVSDGVVDGRRS